MHITHLELLTNDLEATRSFYQEVTGLKILDSSDDAVAFEAGSTLLTFRHTTIPRPVYHFAFTIPSNKLYEALEVMKGRTTLLNLPDGNGVADFAHWNAEAFYFYDNNGNILEFIARHSLDNAEEIPFSSNHICCISEAGLVTRDVPALAAKISQTYTVPLFSKQPAQASFTVMGDDHGLLILVADKRHWFPTTVEAYSFPITIRFRNEAGIVHELVHGI